MRKAILLLHRKIDAQPKCMCGSKMEHLPCGDWVCKRQLRNKEPSKIDLEQIKR